MRHSACETNVPDQFLVDNAFHLPSAVIAVPPRAGGTAGSGQPSFRSWEPSVLMVWGVKGAPADAPVR
jgi:hypothetical protein